LLAGQSNSGKIRIRCGQGLGDAIYLQGVVAYLLSQGQKNLEVCTDWPDVFTHLRPHTVALKNGTSSKWFSDGTFDISPFSRQRINVIAHYSGRRRMKGTCQFEDCFISAGLSKSIDPDFKWKVTNPDLLDRIEAEAGPRKIVFLQHLRPPMDRKDDFGKEMIPTVSSLRQVLEGLNPEKSFVVKVGLGESLDDLPFNMDLRNKLSVKELMDVGTIADVFVGQCSLIIPLSECLRTPAVIVFGAGIRTSKESFISSICPEKLLLRHARKGCLELGLWDDAKDISGKVRSWLQNTIEV